MSTHPSPLHVTQLYDTSSASPHLSSTPPKVVCNFSLEVASTVHNCSLSLTWDGANYQACTSPSTKSPSFPLCLSALNCALTNIARPLFFESNEGKEEALKRHSPNSSWFLPLTPSRLSSGTTCLSVCGAMGGNIHGELGCLSHRSKRASEAAVPSLKHRAASSNNGIPARPTTPPLFSSLRLFSFSLCPNLLHSRSST